MVGVALMMYLTGSVGSAIEPHLTSGRVGYMRAPGGGRKLQKGWVWAADNGCFGKGWPGYSKWIAWLEAHTQQERALCLFATAPDVVGSARESLKRSLPWLPIIKSLGYAPAFISQDGMAPDMLPWGQFEWLFIGGTDTHKLGPEARALISHAHAQSIPVHVGRVNSAKRFEHMAALGCTSVDGTFLAFGPDANLPTLLAWLDFNETQTPLFNAQDLQEATP
jgi:hypothetical protein